MRRTPYIRQKTIPVSFDTSSNQVVTLSPYRSTSAPFMANPSRTAAPEQSAFSVSTLPLRPLPPCVQKGTQTPTGGTAPSTVRGEQIDTRRNRSTAPAEYAAPQRRPCPFCTEIFSHSAKRHTPMQPQMQSHEHERPHGGRHMQPLSKTAQIQPEKAERMAEMSR